MLTIVASAVGLCLLAWIGSLLSSLVNQAAVASASLAALNRAVAEVLAELGESAATAERSLGAIGVVVAYGVAELNRDLYEEPDPSELNLPEANQVMLDKARYAWKKLVDAG